jgi:wyosine [tRNA(Phe)-imidazoG37] synthetase (radical SAM superfamily)
MCDEPRAYEIRIEGCLNDDWSDWFEGLTILSDAAGQTILRGTLVDQSALLGLLGRIHALNLSLISLTRSSHQEGAG